ncbi:nuclear transport factor 2 family protein [Allokutzneria sp. NRRL B-24872]|uniref:YybH family protein n=1 Tax=Allokutzneria sp. NRRL B-24872 TaxID=1137961 RepID=UPI000A365F08|nr:nuclear transport factor 2 family protein [Allokutzneria sp. NRRL B-24872]
MTTDHMPSVRLPEQFREAFNSASSSAVDALYEPDGVFVDGPGTPTTGLDRKRANEKMLALGEPIEVRPRHAYVAGDIALLIVDWSIGDVRGTATDVARRGPDGVWRYVIDNPFGTA